MDLPSRREPTFPADVYSSLVKAMEGPHWIDAIAARKELDILLDASLALAKGGLDTTNEACQEFYDQGLTLLFANMFKEESVNSWETVLHKRILNHAEKAVELIVVKLSRGCFRLLHILAIVFDPTCNFHVFNATRHSETVPMYPLLNDDELFARPTQDVRRGFLVDLVNRFGELKGFQILLDHFRKGLQLSVADVKSLTRPFGLCAEVLTPHTVETYFLPIVEIVREYLNGLTDETIRKVAKSEWNMESMVGIVDDLKPLVDRTSDHEDTVKGLERCLLDIILRSLKISSFNGKLNTLKQLNKIIENSPAQSKGDSWLTNATLTEWMKKNDLLSILVNYDFRAPVYVEQLDTSLRYMLKQGVLTETGLEKIEKDKMGEFPCVDENVHRLLERVLSDPSDDQSPEESELIAQFEATWNTSGKKERDDLLEKVQNMAEYDTEGYLADKVLQSIWNMANREDISVEQRGEVLKAHLDAINFSCCQDRHGLKLRWLKELIATLETDTWVLTSLKQFTAICCLFEEKPEKLLMTSAKIVYRENIVAEIETQSSLINDVVKNLSRYTQEARAVAKAHTKSRLGKYSHVEQVQGRLKFLTFLLKDCKLLLDEPEANQIWKCLVVNPVDPTDRDTCFTWFIEILDARFLSQTCIRGFFRNSVLQLLPRLMTKTGSSCFKKFSDLVEVSNKAEDQEMEKLRQDHMQLWSKYNGIPGERTEPKKKSCCIS